MPPPICQLIIVPRRPLKLAALPRLADTNAQVHELLAPPAEAVIAVTSHLLSNGVSSSIEAPTPNKDHLVVSTTVAVAEAILGCEYFLYTHAPTGVIALRTPAYSLPSSLAASVDFIAPAVRLPSIAAGAAVLPKMTSPDGLFNSPASLRKLYSVGDTVGKAPNNRQAVTGFLGQHFHQSDLDEFNTLFFKQAQGGSK